MTQEEAQDFRRRQLIAAALFSLLGLGSGCASRPPGPDFSGERLQGRLSIQSDTGSSGSSAFELLGNADAGQLELSTPLGSLVARASWSAGSVLLETPHEQRRFNSLDELGQELLGEPIPVAALFDWLRARPWPPSAAAPLPAPSRGFTQLGWRIELDRFVDGLIVARRLAAPALTLRVRLNNP
jgi:outer membrane lipoprotein LolB